MISKHNKNIIDSYVDKILIKEPDIDYVDSYLVLLKCQCCTWDFYIYINKLCKYFIEND